MKNLLFSLIILFSLVASVSAQNIEAIKIDEFENTGCEDYLGRADRLFVQIDNNQNSKGYIFVYTGLVKENIYDKAGKLAQEKFVSPRKNDAQEVIKLLKKQAAFRGFANRTVLLDGGIREKFTVEFWLIPNGIDAPKPSPTLTKMKQRKAKHLPQGLCGGL